MKESLAARQAALLRQNAELDQKVVAIEQRRQQQLQTAKSGPNPHLAKQNELSAVEPSAVLSDGENAHSLSDSEIGAPLSSPERGTSLGLAMDLNASVESMDDSPSKNNETTEAKPRSSSRNKPQLQKKKSTGSVPQTASQSARKNLRRLKSDIPGDMEALESKPEEPSPDIKQQPEANGGEGGGLGLEATVRYQKARLRVLQDELDVSQTQIKELQTTLQQSKAKLDELTSESSALKKKQQQTQQLLEKQQEVSAAQESKQKILETQLSAAQAKIEEIQKAEKQALQQFRSKDVRLNRALEELEKVKSQLQDERRAQGEQTIAKAEYEQVLKENKRLEKQKNELLLAFKKQMKLIDLLKRQRIHMEAAKMLSFTEEEFSKTLELG